MPLADDVLKETIAQCPMLVRWVGHDGVEYAPLSTTLFDAAADMCDARS